jgi:putative ABC transport system permease protein
MKLFLEIAWRNIWRNYQRSLIMIAGISVGLFGLLVYHGFSNGWIIEMVETSIEVELGHLQVYREGYPENPVPGNSFDMDSALIASLKASPGVKTIAPRFKAAVLVSSAEKSGRLELVGIDPLLESQSTIIAASVDSGAYLQPGDNRKIVLGGALAQRLGVDLGEKVVVMAQDRNNELQSYLFRVGGLFNSTSPAYDKMAAFVTLDAMYSLLGQQGTLTSVVIRVDEGAQVDSVVAVLHRSVIDSLNAIPWWDLPSSVIRDGEDGRIENPGAMLRPNIIAGRPALRVDPWWEVSKLLGKMIEMFNSFVWVFYAIIYLAMAFGVVNILLMSVIERTHELGVMRAVGTSPGQVMIMVLLESALLGLMGIVAGGGSAWLVNHYLEIHGIDLSYWSSAMSYMGLSNVIHSKIYPSHWAMAFFSAEAAVMLAAVWPAWRAARLRPVEAIHFE